MDTISQEKSVMIVDDEPVIVNILSKALTKNGYCVSSALNGQECIDIALKIKPRVFLLDIKMPVLDGTEDLPIEIETYSPWFNNHSLKEQTNTGITTGEISLEEIERAAIKATLKKCNGNKRKAARQLCIGFSTLYKKIKKYNIE